MRSSVERQSRLGMGQGCTCPLLQVAPTVPLAASVLNKNNEFQCFFEVRHDLGQGRTAIKLIFLNSRLDQHTYAHRFACPHIHLRPCAMRTYLTQNCKVNLPLHVCKCEITFKYIHIYSNTKDAHSTALAL